MLETSENTEIIVLKTSENTEIYLPMQKMQLFDYQLFVY